MRRERRHSRLRRLQLCEPTGMGALALGPWEAGGSRVADEWRPGENLSCSSAGADHSQSCTKMAQVPC